MTTFSVVVPWRSDFAEREEIWSWNKTRWNMLFPSAEIIECDSGDEIFSRSGSRNKGIAEAKHDIIVLADSDTIPDSYGVFQGVQMAADGHWVICYDEGRYYNLSQELTLKYLGSSPTQPLNEPQAGQYEHKLTSWCGMIVVPKEALEAIHGYDESFRGWGFEDSAAQLALDLVWKRHVRVPTFVMHLWHPRGDADFNQPWIQWNQDIYERYRKCRTKEQILSVISSGHGSRV